MARGTEGVWPGLGCSDWLVWGGGARLGGSTTRASRLENKVAPYNVVGVQSPEKEKAVANAGLAKQQTSPTMASVHVLTVTREDILDTLDVRGDGESDDQKNACSGDVTRALQLGNPQGPRRSRGQEGPAEGDQKEAGRQRTNGGMI